MHYDNGEQKMPTTKAYVEHLERNRNSLLSENVTLKDKLTDAQHAHKQELEQLKQEVEQRTTDYLALEVEYACRESELESFKQDNRKLRNAIDRANVRIDRAEGKLEGALEAVRAMASENNS